MRRYFFDIDTEAWTTVTAEFLPTARHGHSAVLDSIGRMWMFGGAGGETGLSPSNDALQFIDLSNPTKWVKVDMASAPLPRFEHTAVVHENQMWIFGGHTGNMPSGALNDVHYFDMEASNVRFIS